MLKNCIERLFWPTVVFLLFAILFKLAPGRLMDVSTTAQGFKDVVSKAFGIGLGLAFAWLCVRLIDVFLWRPLEARLETTECQALSERMTECQFPAGSALVQQGQPGDSMYILVEGLLSVYIENERDAAPVKLNQIIPGQFFGEMSLLTGDARSATVQATTDVVVFRIGKDDLHPLLEQRPELAAQLAEVVTQRRRQRDRELALQEGMDSDATAEQLLDKMKAFFFGLRGKLSSKRTEAHPAGRKSKGEEWQVLS